LCGFVQATANEKGPSALVLNLLDKGEIRLFISEEVLLEIRTVLNRPELRQKLRGITDERVEALLRRLDSRAILVRQVPRVFEYPRDANDEPYLNLAIVANAKYLVSRDNDLLDLMSAEDLEAQAFRQRYSTLTILDPVAFLRRLRE
jgi:putative PIN family toxin of toxin-antitoxin system